MATNAQVALQAAVTVYSGARGYADARVVHLAQSFKQWLDDQDKADVPPPVSHHISCRSRYRPEPMPCNCTPVPYQEKA